MANVVSTVTGNGSLTVLPSAARTAAPNTFEYEVQSPYIGLHLIIDVTAIGTAPSITVTVSGVDRASGKTYTILASTAITAVGTTVLRVGPGLTAAANATANDIMPPVFRVSTAHGNADSITYSVGAQLLG